MEVWRPLPPRIAFERFPVEELHLGIGDNEGAEVHEGANLKPGETPLSKRLAREGAEVRDDPLSDLGQRP